MDEKVLGIWGAGGLGREILELSMIINEKEKRWSEFVFVVDNITVPEVCGIKVMQYEDAKKQYGPNLEITVGIGEPIIREQKFQQLEVDEICIPTLIHPDVHIPKSTEIGKGVVIQYGCFISCDVKISEYVYIQPQCNIGHDALLAEGCMLSGFANVAGAVSIGRYTYLGLSTVLKEGITIGNNSIIGMGSVVYKDVPDDMVALGNPARPMAKNTDRKVFGH